jgi:outer membrane protein TolC
MNALVLKSGLVAAYLCASVAYNFSQAQELKISLNEAIAQALDQSYSLKIANKNLEIARNNNNMGEAGAYPTVNANLAVNNSFSNINNPTSFLNGASTLGNNSTLAVEASWVLFDGYKVRINKKRLEILEAQQSGSLKLAVEQQTSLVMRAYFNVQVQAKRLGLNADLLALSRDKISYIEAKRAYGQALEFDLLQVNDAYLNDSIQWLLQKNAHEVALQNLAIAMNLEPQTGLLLSLSDTINLTLPTYSYEELRNKLTANNQTLSNLKISETLAETQIELQKSNRYPRLQMNGGLSDQLTIAKISGLPQIPTNFRGGTTFTGFVNFSLAYTIYNGGRIKRSIQTASLQKEIAGLQRKDQERVLLQQLQQNLYRYENQRALLAVSQQLANNASRNLAMAEERFKAGTLNYFDLRTIQINYIRSINALQDAYLNAKTTEIDLLLAVGELIK